MKKEEIKQQNYEKILSTASVLFFTNGISGTNMYQIALASGISKAALYKHFATKYDIAKELVYRRLDKAKADFEEEWRAVPGETGAEDLKRIFDYIVKVVDGDIVICALYMDYAIYAQRFHSDEIAELYEKVDGVFRSGIVGALEKGRADGSLVFSGETEELYEILYDDLIGAKAFFYMRNATRMSPKRLAEMRRRLKFNVDSIMNMLSGS